MTTADGGQIAGCTIASDPYNPFIVEWPAAEKTNLEVASKRGLVVVSYVGCHLKVLRGCDARGSYVTQSSSLNSDRFDIRDEQELYARLPLGAASLAMDLKYKGALSFQYASTGQRVAEKGPTGTSGQCDGATHYVRSFTVGAFRVGALARGEAAAGAGAGASTAGVAGTSHAERDRRGGDLDACLRSKGTTGCDAILQLGLMELNIGLKQEGFGAGLGGLVSLPSLPAAVDASVGGTSLADADTAYLDLVQAAKRAEKSEVASTRAKIAAWEALAAYPGANPLGDAARARVDAWTQYQRRLDERKARLREAHGRFTADGAKLDRLLGYDEDVVSAAQKTAYRQEFVRVYARWMGPLEEDGFVGAAERGRMAKLEAQVKPPPSRPSPAPRPQQEGGHGWAWASVGGAAASVAGSVVFFLSASQASGDGDAAMAKYDAAQSAASAKNARQKVDSADTAYATNLIVGASLVAVGAGLTWLAVELFDDGPASASGSVEQGSVGLHPGMVGDGGPAVMWRTTW